MQNRSLLRQAFFQAGFCGLAALYQHSGNRLAQAAVNLHERLGLAILEAQSTDIGVEGHGQGPASIDDSA
jgi:hypothetical protein